MWRACRRLRCRTTGVLASATATTLTASSCSSSSSPSSSPPPSPTDTTAAAAPTNEHSLLRNLIPMRVHASGPASVYLRHAFLQQDRLIHRFLASLEQLPLPSLPRMLLAEGMQRMLEGEHPQRELRELFEEAEMECRKVLLQLDVSATGAAPYHSPRTSSTERAMWEAVQTDPLTRVLAYELRAAAGFYARLMSVAADPYPPASVHVRTIISSDMRTDDALLRWILDFDAWPRDVETGARTGSQTMPPQLEEVVKELLLLERDAFGVFRFDPRGDNHHLLHALKLSELTKTPKTLSVLRDPVMTAYGNFSLTSEEVHKGRWIEYKLHCAAEDHRVDPVLPLLETVVTRDMITGGELRLLVHYDQPICPRHKPSSREEKGNYGHVEVFEMAVENTNRSAWERFFLDR
jgi:hypothetical protein